ncbi:efflux RND transporter periplasmic adaptor subunit [Pseudomonas sp. Bout1]|jgi:membrane fusion protein, copper/silver efflux system|uniref:efflux RND transporter periplasmic adaptor subunit n=1 Tax=Pseudomonas TaxID=286 RepID=UPI00161E2FC2|nr:MULTISPECIES: efflux RND transporter periplasmic adaptor subunit [Pseudomonas]MBH1966952.1 efflux RND transporter periplasmic adaptor subunit [Pseudomonadales bacterium]MBB4813258.1 Cu(I)/Ag(I) efflux system membrane fusion protein [Pseudomonas rhodesiae]MBH2031881.1 efflux RND transporter periplasmic adaptor subunit [Pseudomonadales bacterium]MBH2077194.1 efflux RND transporter periplasmic adaptor subunit [Pseudomonadales bacterium]MDY7536304.1 efflux RND transporter periplasmic adaptor su
MSLKKGNGALLVGISLALGVAGGYWLAHQRMSGLPNTTQEQSLNSPGERKALYWYDPMYPQQKFDKPGKSPFMDMQLVPQYTSSAGDRATVSIDPSLTQNLGLRFATVSRAIFDSSLDVTGVLGFNERDVAVIQARTPGFVERVYAHAPGDVLKANAALADVLVPEWAAAQTEFLALKRNGDAALLDAARQRLRLTGMPAALITDVERGGKVQPYLTLTSPIAGVLQELNVRAGMTVATGDTLARVNGLSSVWLAVAVPESDAGSITVGQAVEARLPAFPGTILNGRVSAILPETNPDSRTLRVRVELPNPDGRLRPGLTAQVHLNRSTEQSVLWVPSEAVIRTGRRALVMLAADAGRYRPVAVQLGQESDGKTAIVKGLEEGQKVVTSGQFLLDSEASLKGIVASSEEESPPSAAASSFHEADGQIVEINDKEVTLAHGPFKTLGMPGMTMTFPLANPALMQGFKTGDKVRVAVSQTDDGLRVERLEKSGSQP